MSYLNTSLSHKQAIRPHIPGADESESLFLLDIKKKKKKQQSVPVRPQQNLLDVYVIFIYVTWLTVFN